MKQLLGSTSVTAGMVLIGDIFAKELDQNQLISIAGFGIIASIWFFVLRFEELIEHYLKEKI